MTDWTGFTRLMKTWRFYNLHSASQSIAKNTMITYRSRYLIANNTLELVYENVPECIILKWKKIINFLGGGYIKMGHSPRSGPHPTSTPTVFWQIEHWSLQVYLSTRVGCNRVPCFNHDRGNWQNKTLETVHNYGGSNYTLRHGNGLCRNADKVFLQLWCGDKHHLSFIFRSR